MTQANESCTHIHTQRDDISHFLPIYLEKKILKADPFVEIDQEASRDLTRCEGASCQPIYLIGYIKQKHKQGVGQLITMTIERSKAANKGVQYGVCGEQGGEPNSVAFFHKVGTYVDL